MCAAEAALSAQAAQLRALVQGAVQAAEEQCRRVEAAAGVRLAQLGVRLRDMASKVRAETVRIRACVLRTAGLSLGTLRRSKIAHTCTYKD